jgi:hypothetical protein
VFDKMNPIPGEKVYPREVREIWDRARAGDPTVLRDLHKAYEQYPELVQKFGDLVAHAEEALLTLATGACLLAREAIRRRLAQHRAELAADAATPLEMLLVDRIVICWLAVHADELALADHRRELPSASPAVRAAQQRLDAAHRRLLTSLKALAQIKKLLRPPLSPVDMLARTVPETTAGTSSPLRSNGRLTERAMPVAN